MRVLDRSAELQTRQPLPSHSSALAKASSTSTSAHYLL